MRDIMVEFYLNRKKNNKSYIDIYYVPGFFEFSMLIVSVDVFENVTIE